MKGAGFQFIFRVAHYGEAVTQKKGYVTTLAASLITRAFKSFGLCQFVNPPYELIAFHWLNHRSFLSGCQDGNNISALWLRLWKLLSVLQDGVHNRFEIVLLYLLLKPAG